MKKYTQQFFSTIIYNLIFWAILFGAYFIISRNYLMWGIIIAISISIISALLETLIVYFQKKKNKLLIHLFKGMLGFIYLALTSITLVYTIRNIMDKKLSLIAFYLILTIIFFNLFKKVFNKQKK